MDRNNWAIANKTSPILRASKLRARVRIPSCALIKLFKESDNLNFHGLKKRIISADEEWIKEFLLQDGLEILFKALATLGTKGFDTSTAIMDAVQQLECIGCIKAIMSRSCGMEHILMNGEDFVKKLIEGKAI